jgi:predicted amidohydrolase
MEDLSVLLIQTSLFWENIDANLAALEEKIWQNEEPVDLIVLPEMFSTGFTMNPKPLAEPMNSKTFRWMKQQASQANAVVVGSFIVNDQGHYFNRLLAMYPDGTYKQYDKRHLFALAGEDEAYSAGDKQMIFEYRGWKIMPLVCYDLRFPVWSRGAHENGYNYDLLIYVANWPAPRVNAWDILLQARAIENQAYCIGVNRVGKDENGLDYLGHSALYDYTGKSILALREEEKIGQVNLTKAPMDKFRAHFPFYRDADQFDIRF